MQDLSMGLDPSKRLSHRKVMDWRYGCLEFAQWYTVGWLGHEGRPKNAEDEGEALLVAGDVSERAKSKLPQPQVGAGSCGGRDGGTHLLCALTSDQTRPNFGLTPFFPPQVLQQTGLQIFIVRNVKTTSYQTLPHIATPAERPQAGRWG